MTVKLKYNSLYSEESKNETLIMALDSSYAAAQNEFDIVHGDNERQGRIRFHTSVRSCISMILTIL